MKASVLVATAACGVFLLAALLLGVWKWRAMLRASDHLAPHSVDTAHRAALLYSFACLVLIHFAELGPAGATRRTTPSSGGLAAGFVLSQVR